MPLTMVGLGESGRIARVVGEDGLRQHLAELGFVAGERVTVVSKNGGNMILCVKGCRIALDRGMANHIMVTGGAQA